MVVLGSYTDDLRDAILRAKRPSGELLACGLAALLADAHRDTVRVWEIDVVVPVPMHWRRRLLRGGSSADELARGVAVALDIPCRRLLRRRRATRMQNELPVAARRGNVRDAFGPTLAGRVGLLRGRKVLLVDDVTTTGSTLEACRRAAITAGAAAVYAAVVARADRSEETADRDAD
jgi:predicted amidophosphoribosyltransferase